MTEEKTIKDYWLWREDVEDFICDLIFRYEEDETVNLVNNITCRHDWDGITCLKIVFNLLDWIIMRDIKDLDLEEKLYYTNFIEDIKKLKETVEKYLNAIETKNEEKSRINGSE